LRLERNTPPLDICLAAVSNELQEFDKFLQALKDPGQPLPPSFPIGSLKADGFQNDSEGCRNETCPERLRVEKTHFEEAPKICGEKVPSSILRLRCSDNYKTLFFGGLAGGFPVKLRSFVGLPPIDMTQSCGRPSASISQRFLLSCGPLLRRRPGRTVVTC
jgi:hypothetical protein